MASFIECVHRLLLIWSALHVASGSSDEENNKSIAERTPSVHGSGAIGLKAVESNTPVDSFQNDG
jgi:hypothetical protein